MDLGIALCHKSKGNDPDRTRFVEKKKLGSFTVAGNIRTNPLRSTVSSELLHFLPWKKRDKDKA